jgi:hypothetical protein
MLGAREKNVNAVRGAEEAALVLRVATNKRDDDDLGFFTLEVIYCGDSDGFKQNRLAYSRLWSCRYL